MATVQQTSGRLFDETEGQEGANPVALIREDAQFVFDAGPIDVPVSAGVLLILFAAGVPADAIGILRGE